MRKARRPAAIALALALALQLGAAVPAAAADITATAGYENGNSSLNLTQIARYTSGQFNVDGGVMEIVAYNRANGFAYATTASPTPSTARAACWRPFLWKISPPGAPSPGSAVRTLT